MYIPESYLDHKKSVSGCQLTFCLECNCEQGVMRHSEEIGGAKNVGHSLFISK